MMDHGSCFSIDIGQTCSFVLQASLFYWIPPARGIMVVCPTVSVSTVPEP